MRSLHTHHGRPGPAAVGAVLLLAAAALGMQCNSSTPHEPVGQQTFASPQSHPIVLSADGTRLFVANTTSGTVSVIDTATLNQVGLVHVGLEPVGLALKPDGSELWVSNHLSDSVSVIDLVPTNDTHLAVIATVQDLDASGVTQFDEPVGIAFASNAKAYVALSSRNDIAVVDATTYAVTGRIHITAQEPRSLRVVGNRLYVAAFESHNRSELSVCPDGPLPGETDPTNQCTMDATDVIDFIIVSPNIPGADSRIVIDPDLPDRDLFVINTTTDTLVESVEEVGTLLYDLAVSSAGQVFITQTEARNEVNGGQNDVGQNNLPVLENRMFSNQIGRVDCTGPGCALHPSGPVQLEPALPAQPAPGDALATPYGIEISGDDTTLVATAAGTSRIFTLNATTGAVRDILDLNAGVSGDFGQQIPKGVALRSDVAGAPQTAYVLNTLENTVSVVDVSDPDALVHVTKVAVGNDPTPDDVRRGRIAFTNAFASDSGTFSCESCHPDGNTDQLLWRIGGPCFFGACSGHDEIRSTMPVRGLKNTLPLHWDGTLGDPNNGPDGSTGLFGFEVADCDPDDADGDHDCFRNLVNASLSGVMCDQISGCTTGPSGQTGQLTNDERDDMAVFLANVSYPPARERAVDDVMSSQSIDGFSDFFLDHGGLGSLSPPFPDLGVRTCADMDSGCHALPLGVSTDSETLAAFDAPTMRGMTDRWLQFSIGITNNHEFLEFVKTQQVIDLGTPFLGEEFLVVAPATLLPFDPAEGFEEDVTLAAAFMIFFPVYLGSSIDTFQMFEETSTGISGAVGRQVTLSPATTTPGELPATEALLADLEAADARGAVNLQAYGVWDQGVGFLPRRFSYRSGAGLYRDGNGAVALTRAQLIAAAQAGDLFLTLTADLRQNVGIDPQPLLSTWDDLDGSGGNPDVPIRGTGSGNNLQIRGFDVLAAADVLVDGQVVPATLNCISGGTFNPTCSSDRIQVVVNTPMTTGLRMLQVQNPSGLQSNEFPVCIGVDIDDCL